MGQSVAARAASSHSILLRSSLVLTLMAARQARRGLTVPWANGKNGVRVQAAPGYASLFVLAQVPGAPDADR